MAGSDPSRPVMSASYASSSENDAPSRALRPISSSPCRSSFRPIPGILRNRLEGAGVPSAALDAPTLTETATADSVVMPVPAEPPSGLWILALWTRDVDDGTDFRSHGDRITLIGFDSRQGGERVLLAEPGSYAKPMVTPDGGRDRVLGAERGTGLCDLVGRGAPTSYWERIYLDVWADPET